MPDHEPGQDGPISSPSEAAAAILADLQAAATAERLERERTKAADRLVPRAGELAVGDAAIYRTVSITGFAPPPASLEELTQPVDLVAVGSKGSAPRIPPQPAEGVLLAHEQGWRLRGLTLGRLVHSLCLAPGEVTQIAIVDREHTMSGRSDETIEEGEQASKSADRSRGIHQVTESVARELQYGRSGSTTLATQSEAGASGMMGLMGVSASGSTSGSVATQVNVAVGTRRVAAQAQEQVRERTHQQASAVRARKAVAVEEVSELQSEQFRTRVVANYNHMHALNMQYYEVVQVYDLQSRVVSAERCLFIPMEPLAFDPVNVRVFAAPLARAASEAGLPTLAKAILQHAEDAATSAARIELAGARVTELEKQLADARKQLAESRKLLDDMKRTLRDDPPPALLASEIKTSLASGEAQLKDMENLLASEARKATDARAEHTQLLKAQSLQQQDILAQLNEAAEYFNHALWMQMDPATVATLLDGKSYTAIGETTPTPLAETIDPAPIAVTGNYVGFRWRFPPGRHEGAREAFESKFLAAEVLGEPPEDTVAIPTGALFAEAVLGQSNSAERLDMTRFWHWDDNTIPIRPTGIRRLRSRRAQPADAPTPGEIGSPTVHIAMQQPWPDRPDPNALNDALGKSPFQDMTGASAVAGMLDASMQAAEAGAHEAAAHGQKVFSEYLDHAERVLPMVMGALAGNGDGAAELSPSMLGALTNALGVSGEIETSELLSLAVKAGLLL